ncbi:ATP-binding SpoIIE family protein phosphatase [Streptomyces sp. NPDC047042]|uniref:ATP-binding SpoIIE family protein phosphatase n=1 Tax=Streptomyces sp. NPDC047042 TaxID=3154807 RepID=UPI0034021152
MAADVDALLRDLARTLRRQAGQLTDDMIRAFRSELPELWQHEDLAAQEPATTAGHVASFLNVLEQGLDVSEVEAPPEAIESARRVAGHGMPISDLLRVYRLAHASLLQVLYQQISRLAKDAELIHETMSALIRTSFAYVDSTSEQVVAAYQDERDRWLQRRLIMINEAGKRIGTTLDITRTAEELTEVGTDSFADLVTVDLFHFALTGESARPEAGPPRLRRIARCSVLDGSVDSAVGTGRTLVYREGSAPARVLATGQPLRLHFTASETPAWLMESAEHTDAPRGCGDHDLLLVPLYARGSSLGIAQFSRHRNPNLFDDDDLLLAQEIASRAAVSIDNARRYTQERSVALVLQRSLLPQQAPAQSAVDTASRYLPSGSRAGVGGDWYDVIPLSGARVALVVGDVVGHGIHASATMGRLRTAVRTLADIDLPPDELLTHLDDVVIRLQREEGQSMDEISATCLYAVYDPVSRLCTLASAGHMLPAVATPTAPSNGAPGFRTLGLPDLPIGPPLGLGGFPFEVAQFAVPEGSLLALYTDGLVQSRGRDVDASLTLLHDVLATQSASLEDTCDALLSALLPSRPSDDVALLLVRTRALDSDHVATWDIPSDPAFVSRARAYASDQLALWGLDDLSFTTELLVSELVTNAIRYGEAPIRLRMILQSTLTCEVSDGSSTAPHMRRARAFDEGGRGLLLVAQLGEGWGARHNREGKVIWAELPLSGDETFSVVPDAGLPL